MSTHQPRVYLAGPIGHLTYDKATEWRREAQRLLALHSISAYSPLRAKEFLDTAEAIPSKANVSEHPLGTSKGIMTRDFNDCVSADALLVCFLGVSKPSLGTAMELAWAYDRHIPVVVVTEKDNPNIDHPMMYEAAKFVVPTLAQGIELIRSILRPEVNQ